VKLDREILYVSMEFHRVRNLNVTVNVMMAGLVRTAMMRLLAKPALEDYLVRTTDISRELHQIVPVLVKLDSRVPIANLLSKTLANKTKKSTPTNVFLVTQATHVMLEMIQKEMTQLVETRPAHGCKEIPEKTTS